MVSQPSRTVPDASRFRLANATIPGSLLDVPLAGLVQRDLVVDAGRIAAIEDAHAEAAEPTADLGCSMVLPGFVDVHTHLDKGHISPRKPNPDGTWTAAVAAVAADQKARWSADDVARRMEFSLRCAYAHGTVAIRTHLDSEPPQDAITWPVFEEARDRWAGRIALQAVPLLIEDHVLDPVTLDRVARRSKAAGGLIGAAVARHPRQREAIRAVIACADRYGLNIDMHLDETLDPESDALRTLAEEILAMRFEGRVMAGHCCSLSQQSEADAARTVARVAEAKIGIVSLPLCNLYLQDRGSGGTTPRFRGVTLIRELISAGVTVACGSDNTRDPFYAYGDLDGLEVLRESVRIAHLDHPMDDAPALVTRTPALLMGLNDAGRIGVGLPADLVLCEGRRWDEVLSRPESGRIILRGGRQIDAALPEYRQLDDLMT